MKNEVWQKAEQLFHAALDLPEKDRSVYLRRECANDDILFSEVESLLYNFHQNSEFLNEPIFEKGLEVIGSEFEKDMSGEVIGYYQLQEKIGAGGMGEVYKAVDTRLNRRVALKFLSASLKDDHAAKRRFLKEARAVAMLEHPNICAVHGIEQSDDHQFIVMQYIEGKTLAESINGENVSVEKFRSLARQIIGAVAFAHSHGVIHRDLKPGNIMLTAEGQVKVLDFGLAKIVPQKHITENNSVEDISHFSQNGLVIGTVSYMSPEQLRGEKLDYRSDIFSLGIVLYELLCRYNPYSRKSQAETIAAILSENPFALKKFVPDLNENLVNLVEKSLRKNKQERFQSAAEMLVELNKSESEIVRKTFPKRFKKMFANGIFVFMILIVVWLGTSFYYPASRQKTLAVLPISFENSETGKRYLADDLTQSIIDKLSNLSDVKVKNRYSAAQYLGEKSEPQTAGRELDADAVFSGVIRDRADGLFLETKITRTSDGTLIDTNALKIDETKMIGLPNDIAERIVQKIQSRLTDEDKINLGKKETESNEAKKLYLEGLLYLDEKHADSVQKSIDAFTKAKDIDRNYAKAWAGLADAYLSQSAPGISRAVKPQQSFEWAYLAAKKAVELDNTLCESYYSLGLVSLKYHWNWTEAEDYFRTAIDRDPNFLQARFGLVNALKMQKRYDEALEEIDKIKVFDPLSIASDLQTALIYYKKRDYSQTDSILSKLMQRDSRNRQVTNVRVYQLLMTGRFNEALEILEPLYNSKKEEDKILAAAPLGFAYAKTGRRDKAFKIIEELGRLEKIQYVPAQEKALVYVGLGDYDKVFERLNLSCAERFSSLPGWINDPIVDEVKNDPRFDAIRKCVHL